MGPGAPAPHLYPVPDRSRLELPQGYPWPLPDTHGRTPWRDAIVLAGLTYWEVTWTTRTGSICRRARMWARNWARLTDQIEEHARLHVTGTIREPVGMGDRTGEDLASRRELAGICYTASAIAWPLPEYVALSARISGMLDPARNEALGGPPWPAPALAPAQDTDDGWRIEVRYPDGYTGPR